MTDRNTGAARALSEGPGPDAPDPALREVWRLVGEADEMAYGPARSMLLERAVTLADRASDIPGAGELEVAARIALMEAYGFGGEPAKQFVPFDWLLARYDEAPPWFGPAERAGVLWNFRWVTTGMLGHPDVPLDRISAGIDQMADRYRAAGAGDGPVLRARFELAEHLYGAAAAEDAFQAWVAAPRSELSDCAQCEAALVVRQLAATGRHEEAVAEAAAVLDGSGGCPEQPQQMIGRALESLLLVGDGDRAAAEHLRGVRLLRGAGLHDNGHVEHLLACARTGRLQRGLDLLEEWLPGLDDPDGLLPPLIRMRFCAAAARLLRAITEAGAGAERVAGGAGLSAAELAAALSDETRTLAARFDSRNGTSTMTGQIEAMLAAGPLPDLPLAWLGRSPRSARVLDTGAAADAAREEPAAREGAADPEFLAAAADVDGLVEALDAANQSENDTERAAVLLAWRGIRAGEPVGTHPRAAARLEAWLAVEDLLGGQLEVSVGTEPAPSGELTPSGLVPDDPLLAQAERAAQKLRSAGAAVEALLHLQAAVLAAEQSGRMERGAAAALMAGLAMRVVVEGTPADAGIALTRLVIARHVAGLDLSPDPPADSAPDLGGGLGGRHPRDLPSNDPAAAIADPLAAGIAALERLHGSELGHQERRSLARLLRIRAAELPLEEAVEDLRRAVALLPDGVRPLERALAGADLADALQQVRPDTALAAWHAAARDAYDARHDGLLGQVLAAAGSWRHATGDPAGAVADLAAAVPLLDEHALPMLAAQARFDLARALLEDHQPMAAAELAEATLADVTELLAADRIEPAGPEEPIPDPEKALGSGEVHLAGCAAFAAAEAALLIGESRTAWDLARRSAGWHRRNGNLIAEAESWQLASRASTGDPLGVATSLATAAELADAGGDWARAATCRRERAGAVNDLDGPAAALEVLAGAGAALDALGDDPAGRHVPPEVAEQARQQLAWHRFAIAEQQARVLAVAGRYEEALTAVDGLEGGYRELGDAWSARDVLGLRGQVVAELGDVDAGVADLWAAAEEALAAGDDAQVRGLASRLAAVLDDAGRPEEAERTWQHFAGLES